MANVAVTTGLGVVFWVAAARLYNAHTVGRDSALIAAMLELSVICQLNLVNGVNRFLPSLRRHTAVALLGVYALSGAMALVVGGLFVLFAPMASHQFLFLRGSIAPVYIVAQVLWTWFTLQDAALAAMRRAPWILVENGSYGVLKLLALPLLLALGTGNGVFLATALPVVLLLVPVNLFLFRTAIPEHLRSYRPAPSILRVRSGKFLLRFMAQDYAATVLSQSTATALPVLVIALVGSRANAYFYIPYMMVSGLTLLFYGACTSLIVEGGRAERQIRTLSKRIARLIAFTLLPAVVVMVAAAPLILLPFGSNYVRAGTSVLRILSPGCVFRTITFLYIAIARLQGRGSRIIAVVAVQTALLLSGTVILARPLGLDGIAISWSVGAAIAAAGVIPFLIRFLRSTQPLTPSEQPLTQPSPQDLGVSDVF